MALVPTSMYNGFPCLILKTSAGVSAAEEILRSEGRSYRTKITKSKKRGIEYVVMVLD
jgi:hypothetical protein